MEMGSSARTAMAIIVSQTMTPSPKHQDLQEKHLVEWMEPKPSKFQTLVFVVEGYYSSESSSSSPKRVF